MQPVGALCHLDVLCIYAMRNVKDMGQQLGYHRLYLFIGIIIIIIITTEF